MKANELMIGDWVRVIPYKKNGRIYRIDYTNGKGNEYVGVIDGDFDIELLEPIPITQEILEKNGFTVSKYHYPESNIETDKFSLAEVGDNYVREVVLLPITMNCTWSFGSVNGVFIPVVRYVHELQHALRLCGIEKEIVL